ncbi:T9SS type A sorting domain-containing protein, partial [uncultured Chryseobacterium sp.]|uniref:T9SS type A sorting domain-containing protein n=1 Tax=uncultured Chryseobacterium sp. TaxID=259322 RepID=UPI00258340CD
TVTTQDGGFLLAGTSYSGKGLDKKEESKGGSDIWLIRINEFGDELWQKTLGSSSDEEARAVIQTSYNFKNRDVLMGMSVVSGRLEDGSEKSKGILLGGYTQAEGRVQTDDETFWMLYLDQNGNEQWRKHVKGESRKKEERLSDLKLNRDGSIVLAGTSAEELGKENWKIVKLGDRQVDQLIEKYDIKIYPNPVSDYAYIEIGFDFKDADILLYDMSGRQLQSIKTKNKVTKVNTQALVQGAYLVTIKTDTNKTANAKLIKK